jgi:hypothetical protein
MAELVRIKHLRSSSDNFPASIIDSFNWPLVAYQPLDGFGRPGLHTYVQVFFVSDDCLEASKYCIVDLQQRMAKKPRSAEPISPAV